MIHLLVPTKTYKIVTTFENLQKQDETIFRVLN
jgi:hypothetical protein